MNNNDGSLCRVCLEDGATTPLFETEEKKYLSIQSKLSFCVSDEVKDIDGYPRNICSLCEITLNNVYNFLKKYKESCQILESGLHIVVKQEFVELNDYGCNEQIEVEINEIKTEPQIDFVDASQFGGCDLELVSPVQLKIKSKVKKKIKRKIKKGKVLDNKNKTNKIASSILEGDFVWNGEKWCCLKQLKEETNYYNLPIKIMFNNAKQFKYQVKSLKLMENGLKKDCVKKLPKNNTTTIASPALDGLQSKALLPSIKRQIEGQIRQKRERDSSLKIPKLKTPPESRLCDLCGLVCKTQEQLTMHKNKIHLKTPMKCPTCSKICASSYYLNRHIKRVHTEHDKNFICSVCGRRFAFKGELRTHHKTVHEKHLRPKKKYACKLCDKIYACPKSVLVHERSVHTGERPATCSVCGTSFYHDDYLKQHMRLHTGETPFKCPVCGRGYAQRCNMKSHIRIHRVSELDSVTLSKIKPNYLRLMKV